MCFLLSRLSWLAAYTIYCLILVLFLLNENLKYAAAVVSFNPGMPSFQHFLWKWKRTVSLGWMRPLFKTPGNQHPGGDGWSGGFHYLQKNKGDVKQIFKIPGVRFQISLLLVWILVLVIIGLIYARFFIPREFWLWIHKSMSVWLRFGRPCVFFLQSFCLYV